MAVYDIRKTVIMQTGIITSILKQAKIASCNYLKINAHIRAKITKEIILIMCLVIKIMSLVSFLTC